MAQPQVGIPTLSEAAVHYLAGLGSDDRNTQQHEVYRFVRWYGAERTAGDLIPHRVGAYAEAVESGGGDLAAKLEPVRSFLTYIKKQGWTERSMAVHLRAKRSRSSSGAKTPTRSEQRTQVTREGYDRLQQELEGLKQERPRVAEMIRRAAADKDFRENAPLDAAREHQGIMEARIRELERIVAGAEVVDPNDHQGEQIYVGSSVQLWDVALEEELTFTLVGPDEANPAQGRISIASPTGGALLGRRAGDEIQVQAPAGIVHYRILHTTQQ